MTTKENAPEQEGRGQSTSDTREHTDFPADKRGLPILDAAGLEVMKAWRYFSTVPGDIPALAAAALVVAWAIRGRT